MSQGIDLTDGMVAVGGALVAGFLSGRQYSADQLAGTKPPTISRGAVVAAACIAAALAEIGGDDVSERLLAFGVGAGAAEIARPAFQRGAAGVGPNVSGAHQQPGLLDTMIARLRSLMPSQPQYSQHQQLASYAL